MPNTGEAVGGAAQAKGAQHHHRLANRRGGRPNQGDGCERGGGGRHRHGYRGDAVGELGDERGTRGGNVAAI